MRARIVAPVIVATLLGQAATAAADWPRPWVMPPLANGPEIGVEVMLGKLDLGPDDLTLVGLDFTGRHRFDRLGVQLGLPVTHTTTDGNDGTSLGNLTAGLDYQVAGSLRGDRHSLGAIGLSLSLPTASDSGDGLFASASHALFRVTDPGRYAPDTTTLRIYGDWRTGSPDWFFQGELGLHTLIQDNRDDEVLVRLGLGGGVNASANVAFVGELTTMSDILDDDNDAEDFLHTLDLGVRFLGGSSIFGIRLYVPVDDVYRDRDAIGVGFDFAAVL